MDLSKKLTPHPRAYGLILLVFILAVIAIATPILLKSQKKTHKEQIIAKVTATLTPIPTDAAIPGWKVFENDKIKISYPQNWTINTNNQGNNANLATFSSSDYKQNLAGYPEKGYWVTLYIGRTQFDGKVGLISTKPVAWLGQEASLQEYKYDANDLVLTATFNEKKYQMVMTVSSDEVKQVNTGLFLQVANTLKIK